MSTIPPLPQAAASAEAEAAVAAEAATAVVAADASDLLYYVKGKPGDFVAGLCFFCSPGSVFIYTRAKINTLKIQKHRSYGAKSTGLFSGISGCK